MTPFDEYYPTAEEIDLAYDVFINSLAESVNKVKSGEMSKDLAFKIAATKVWATAKKFQDEYIKASKGGD